MSLEKITNHVEQAESRLIEQYKNSDNFKSLLKSLILPLQELENETFDVYSLRWVDTAIGKQLDLIGTIVGESRLGRTDEEYRIAILTRISINIGGGTPELLINVIRQLYNTDEVSYHDLYPAYYSIAFKSDTILPNINSFIDSISPAGVGASTLIQYQGTPFVFGTLTGAISDYQVRGDDFTFYDLELVTESGDHTLETVAESKIDCEHGEGFATVSLNRPSFAFNDGDLLDLGDGNDLLLQLENAIEDYTISEYGGKLATQL